MRDPARIDRILRLIRNRWKATPDLRLGQLLVNHHARFDNAPYHVEDDVLERSLYPANPCGPCQGLGVRKLYDLSREVEVGYVECDKCNGTGDGGPMPGPQ